MVTQDDDDAALVEAFRAGEREAFACLVLRHRSRVVKLATAVLGDTAGAEDIAQEACYRAYFEIQRLREPGRFGAWICGIAVNLARMSLRSSRALLSLDTIDDLRSFAPMPEDTVIARDATQRLQTALDELPPEMREAVWLHYVEGMSYDEAGALTGATPGKLRVLSHRARQRLQVELADQRPNTKRRSAVEVIINNVWIRVRKDGGPDPVMRTPRWMVPLREKDGERQLFIFMAREANTIAFHVAGIEAPRPWTPDLTARLLTAAGATVERVTVTDIVDDLYLSSVDLRSGRKHSAVDARPSDAINLALSLGAPIYVADALMAKQGVPNMDAWDRLLTYGAKPEPDGAEMEWVSQIELVKKQHSEGRLFRGRVPGPLG